MRAYRKTLIERLRYESKGAALPVELLLRPIRLGYKVKVIEIPYRSRIGESTMQPFAERVVDTQAHLAQSFRVRW